jgi:hypothetical protein
MRYDNQALSVNQMRVIKKTNTQIINAIRSLLKRRLAEFFSSSFRYICQAE